MTLMNIDTVARLTAGVRAQLVADGHLQISGLHQGYTVDQTTEDMMSLEQYADIRDEITGVVLPAHLVKAARELEITYLQTFPVYRKVPRRNVKGKIWILVCPKRQILSPKKHSYNQLYFLGVRIYGGISCG